MDPGSENTCTVVVKEWHALGMAGHGTGHGIRSHIEGGLPYPVPCMQAMSLAPYDVHLTPLPCASNVAFPLCAMCPYPFPLCALHHVPYRHIPRALHILNALASMP